MNSCKMRIQIHQYSKISQKLKRVLLRIPFKKARILLILCIMMFHSRILIDKYYLLNLKVSWMSRTIQQLKATYIQAVVFQRLNLFINLKISMILNTNHFQVLRMNFVETKFLARARQSKIYKIVNPYSKQLISGSKIN